MVPDPDDPLVWSPPGPGAWALDRSHVNRPATLINQYVQSIGTGRGTRRVFAELGAPVDALEFRFVNGLVYSRVRPLVRPDDPARRLPPLPLLRLLVRLHPAMRRRRRIAERVFDVRPWRAVVDEWRRPGGGRDRIEAANLALQDVALGALDDAALVAHATRTVTHAVAQFEEHFWLHGYDLGPIGFLLHAAHGWGIPASDVVPLLEGASPSTSSAERALRRIRDAVDAAGASPTTLDELRAVSPAIDADVEAVLRLRGRLVFSRYDLDGLTLQEAPAVVLATILSARDDQPRAAAAAAALAVRTASVRDRVPAGERELFDRALSEARAAMDLRDDNGPHTVEWPLGLVRSALLELGRRMVERGLAEAPEHALELAPDEIPGALTAGAGPGATVLAGRQRWRTTVNVDGAPRILGGPEPAPPLEVLPAPLARVAGMIQMVIAEAGIDGIVRTSGLRGVGVGAVSYRGTARLADSPEAALAVLEPGDVLVVPTTTPAFNLVLTMAGAVVTAEGGALSHAAVLARELGIPAVVGAPRALADIPDGATVEVDPVAGEVRVIGPA
jgi:phosphohistidine swiveling domain-containing protein